MFLCVTSKAPASGVRRAVEEASIPFERILETASSPVACSRTMSERRFPMFKRALLLTAFLVASACGGSNQAANNPSPSGELTPSASAAPANLDPCQLVTQQEASQLAGASFAAGKEETTSGGTKICTYGGQTLNVFLVQVAVASDAKTAQADWVQEESEANAGIQKLVADAGGSVTLNAADISLSGADKAAALNATATISGQPVNIAAIYVLKGAVFFTFSDLVLGKAGPTSAAMQAQAQTTLTRV